MGHTVDFPLVIADRCEVLQLVSGIRSFFPPSQSKPLSYSLFTFSFIHFGTSRVLGYIRIRNWYTLLQLQLFPVGCRCTTHGCAQYSGFPVALYGVPVQIVRN